MPKSNKYIRLYFWLLGTCAVLLYVFWIRVWVIDLYAGKASDTLTEIVQWIYPRFFTEKHRFEVTFFLAKADQVVFRFWLVLVGILYFYPCLPQPKENTSIDIRFCYYFTFLALFFTWDWYIELSNLYEARFFYQPVFLLKLCHLPFPTREASLGLCILMWGSALGVSWAGKWRVHCAVVFVGLFIVLQGYQFSFHKIDHHFALFSYWAVLMPFLLSGALPFSILPFVIALPYTIAGIEKIAVGGLAWFMPYTLRGYLRLHGEVWGLWVAEYIWLCGVLSILTVLFEIFFITVVWFRWAKWVFLPAGVLFHILTYLLMGVGAWLHPWWLCYGVFLWNFKEHNSFSKKLCNIAPNVKNSPHERTRL